jgi:hypothetical protein
MFALLTRPSRSRRAGTCLSLFVLFTTLAVAAPAAKAQPITITGVNLTDFQIVNNVLTATGTVTGTIAGLPFTTDITDFALQLVPDDPNTPAVECSVLHLQLAPINLALLGLFVDTSQICLDLTATEGGGLLGDLLCSLAGGDLLGIPIIPDLNQLSDLEAGLAEVLDGALGQEFSAAQQPDSVCTGECEILDLVLGPVDLSLLGLNVSLDDCNDGPVEVCISSSRGQGILGDLLCGLTGAQLGHLSLADITRLVDRAVDLLADGSLSRQDIASLRSLLGRLLRT